MSEQNAQNDRQNKTENGNVLFLILIAVALFAALSYAVTQSSRSSGDGVSKDTAKLYASQILQHAASVEQAITRMRVIDRVPEWGIDFSSSGTSATANASCTGSHCRIFSDKGGSVAPFVVSGEYRDSGNPTTAMFRIVPVDTVGSSLDDVMIVYSGVNLALCEAVNKLAKVTIDLDTIETYGGTIHDYSGTMTSLPSGGGLIGDQNAALIGRNTGCFQHNSAGYQVFHVVMTR